MARPSTCSDSSETALTGSYIRFVAILAIGLPLAAIFGNGRWG
jgi:hypothetical protein